MKKISVFPYTLLISFVVFIECSVAQPAMVLVNGGTFPTSSAYANSTVATFRIGKYEVTWAEWQQVRSWAIANGYADLAGVGTGSADNHPVRGISFYNALKWLNARSEKEGLMPAYEVNGAIYRTGENFPVSNANANGYRLPTAAEWEWAASGGVLSQEYNYSGSNDLSAVAWANSSDPEPKPVGTKAANELGIHDMCGNVWEWTFLPTYHRGGCWIDAYWEEWFNVRAISNGWPGHGPEYFGLRVAQSASNITADSDGDGVNDYREAADSTDPNDPASFNPLSRGLVAYYPFNGNANDESGNSFSGTMPNGALATVDRFHDKDSAYYFNGINQYVEYPKFGLTNARTFTGWVQFADTTDIGRPEVVIIGQMQTTGEFPLERWHFHVDPQSLATFYHSLGFPDDNRPYGVLASARNHGWHHYAAIVEPNSANALKVTMFLNGTEIGRVSSRAPNELDAPYQSMRLNGGNSLGDVYYYRGGLDDIRVYNRALSPIEVKQLYYQEGFNGEQRSFFFDNANIIGHYSQTEYDLNRTNGQVDVTTNPSAFNLFTQEEFNSNRTAGQSDVISNPTSYGLYTSDSIMDLRMGGLMIPKAEGVATVTFQPQTTTNLASKPFTNNGAPITFEIPMSANHGFMRVEAKPLATPAPLQP